LGFLLKDFGRFAETEAAYRHALGISPDNATYKLQLGVLLLYAGRWSEGGALFEARLDKGFKGVLCILL
jgi:cytochrome c-type biogenesis protein CcmH/NrfG